MSLSKVPVTHFAFRSQDLAFQCIFWESCHRQWQQQFTLGQYSYQQRKRCPQSESEQKWTNWTSPVYVWCFAFYRIWGWNILTMVGSPLGVASLHLVHDWGWTVEEEVGGIFYSYEVTLQPPKTWIGQYGGFASWKVMGGFLFSLSPPIRAASPSFKRVKLAPRRSSWLCNRCGRISW